VRCSGPTDHRDPYEGIMNEIKGYGFIAKKEKKGENGESYGK
jgi:hypothetical protein